jgi:hypothetical protein
MTNETRNGAQWSADVDEELLVTLPAIRGDVTQTPLRWITLGTPWAASRGVGQIPPEDLPRSRKRRLWSYQFRGALDVPASGALLFRS